MKKLYFKTCRLSLSTGNLIPGILLIISLCFLLFFSGCKKDKDEDNGDSIVTLKADEFSGTNLNAYWKWANQPDNWDAGGSSEGWLTIIGNLNANIFCEDNTSRLYQEITSTSDFDISTRMYCQWGYNGSDVAGIIVKSKTSGDWVLIKLWMWGDGSGRLEFQTKCDDIISPVPGSESINASGEYFLRLKRTGNNYTAYFKTTDGANWTEIGSTTFDDDIPLQVGLFGGVDEGDGQVLVQFDYFRI